MGAVPMPTFQLDDWLVYVAIRISAHPYWTVTLADCFLLLLVYGGAKALGLIPARGA